MSDIAVILLAAGRSSRMEGANKLLLPWQSTTISGHVVNTLREAGFDRIIGVANHITLDHLTSLGIQTIENARFMEGMTTSIQAGISVAGDAEAFMICPGDLPYITSSEYQLVADSLKKKLTSDPNAIAVPVFHGQKGHPVIFSAAYRDEIMKHTEMEGCSGIIKSNQANVLKVEMPTDHVLRDIDTREDYIYSQ
ncbi:nucleotidyltransferase family protein [Fulvivirga sedimenti]|uniref:Nucleotidyltransferase family protein n=1 Tax=Fulvivirga sedimenti TaxID=2879465 RepID=A0A9X1KW12_9BACT|nr:nucleotidyltransferase family protein [Fulvivirga sedimenti]MCA6073489.1 nucleotidyltransferase family protein [Fulvivirga sedimenti]